MHNQRAESLQKLQFHKISHKKRKERKPQNNPQKPNDLTGMARIPRVIFPLSLSQSEKKVRGPFGLATSWLCAKLAILQDFPQEKKGR